MTYFAGNGIAAFNTEGRFIGNVRNDGKNPDLLKTNSFSPRVFSALKQTFGIHNFRPNQVLINV